MRMKNYLIALLIIVAVENSSAQAPSWAWAKSAGGTKEDYVNSVTTDASGNVYIAGDFLSPTIVIGSTILSNNGGPDMFIAKYDSNGNALWAKSAGRGNIDYASSLVCDGFGNIYAAGTFVSDSITFGSFTLFSKGEDDVFLVKYDNNGNVIWAVSAGNVERDIGFSVCIDAFGNIYVGGWTGSTSNPDILILKYDSGGNQVWAKSAAGNSFDYAYSIAADGFGNIYLAGEFWSDSISFGPLVLINSNVSGYAPFIVKLDSSGTALWGKAAGGNADGYGNSVTTDTKGNAYVAGQFDSPFIVWGQDTLKDGGMFIAKYDSMGNELWAKGAIEGWAQAYSVATDMQGNVYVSGDCGGDSILFGNVRLYLNPDEGYLFIVKYDTNGNAMWAISAGDSSYGSPFTYVAVDASGSVYAAGGFSGDTIVFETSVLVGNGGYCGFGKPCYDVFLAKLLSSPLPVERFTNNKPFTIYPNPTNGIFTISFDKNIWKGEINIYNIMGGNVYSGILNGKQITMNCKLASGIYFVQIKDGCEVWTKKIMKE